MPARRTSRDRFLLKWSPRAYALSALHPDQQLTVIFVHSLLRSGFGQQGRRKRPVLLNHNIIFVVLIIIVVLHCSVRRLTHPFFAYILHLSRHMYWGTQTPHRMHRCHATNLWDLGLQRRRERRHAYLVAWLGLASFVMTASSVPILMIVSIHPFVLSFVL